MKKKFGGIIRNWQIHHLNYAEGVIEKLYPGQKAQPMVFTGTVVEDPTGRWQPGYHMRSSLIVSINKERTQIETLKSIYKMEAESEGKDMFDDLGNNVLKIFY